MHLSAGTTCDSLVFQGHSAELMFGKELKNDSGP